MVVMLDATKRMEKWLGGRLGSDEVVLAGVSAHREGTTSAAMLGATSAILGAEAGSGVSFRDVPDRDGGAGDGQAALSPYLYLVLTSRRVLVVRRSALGRPKDVAFEAPVEAVDALRLKPSAGRLELLLHGGHALTFETPKAPKFLPEVYRRLPALLARAKGGEA